MRPIHYEAQANLRQTASPLVGVQFPNGWSYDGRFRLRILFVAASPYLKQ